MVLENAVVGVSEIVGIKVGGRTMSLGRDIPACLLNWAKERLNLGAGETELGKRVGWERGMALEGTEGFW